MKVAQVILPHLWKSEHVLSTPGEWTSRFRFDAELSQTELIFLIQLALRWPTPVRNFVCFARFGFIDRRDETLPGSDNELFSTGLSR